MEFSVLCNNHGSHMTNVRIVLVLNFVSSISWWTVTGSVIDGCSLWQKCACNKKLCQVWTKQSSSTQQKPSMHFLCRVDFFLHNTESRLSWQPCDENSINLNFRFFYFWSEFSKAKRTKVRNFQRFPGMKSFVFVQFLAELNEQSECCVKFFHCEFWVAFVSDMIPFANAGNQEKVVDQGQARVIDLPPIESYPQASIQWFEQQGQHLPIPTETQVSEICTFVVLV